MGFLFVSEEGLMQKLEIQLNLPNQLTILRVLLTPVFVVLLLSSSPFQLQLALIVYIIAALTDWYDGWIARKMGYTTRWGKFLDPLADKILSSAALFAFVALDLVDAWMVWVVVLRDFLITGLRSYAEILDKPIVTTKGAQAKTFGQFVVIYYILILYVGRSMPPVYQEFGPTIDALMHPKVLYGMMLTVMLSTVGTGIAYLFDNRQVIRELLERVRGS
jgi:CDP-diacylglycerol--glycerol-3-phosphate 3-phosphatidyltransferase